MEEINFSPSVKQEIFLIVFAIVLGILFGFLGLIFLPLFLGIIFAGILFFIAIGGILSKVFTTYTITDDNDIEIKYNFITSNKVMIRTDQITSVILNRTFIQKMFGLGSISFGIFGSSGLMPVNPGQQNQQYLGPRFLSIKNYQKIFEELSKRIEIEKNSDVIYKENPSSAPAMFKLFFNLAIVLMFIILIFVTFALSIQLEYKLIISSAFGIFSFIFFINVIISFWGLRKIKKTHYIIKESYIERNHRYFFSNMICRVPTHKITNSKTYKNVISYSLFKVGNVKIFTGGNEDPIFIALKDYNKFSRIVSNVYSRKEHINLDTSDISDILDLKEESGYKTKPGKSFFLGHLFRSSMSLVITIIMGLLYTPFFIFTGITLIFFITSNISKILLYKNTRYEFFINKVVTQSGILNITTREIYFKNVKHIEITRFYCFERILKQGTIHIYTAGTDSLDTQIESIPDYKEVYKELKSEIK